MTIIRELHTRLSRLTWREKVRNVGNDHRSPIPSAGHYERRLFKKYGTQPMQEARQAIAEVILDHLSNHS